MPHITLEISQNVDLDHFSFFEELSQALVQTGHVSRMGIKCRIARSAGDYIIDGSEHYKMVNLLIRLREGRPAHVLQNFSQIGMKLLEKHFSQDVKNKVIILSTEIKELKHGLDLTQNFIR